jgi:myosin-5
MIENKLGILDLLDEESRLPSGADASLINKLYQRFAVPTQKFFDKPRFGQNAFTIKHYATDVTYDIDGFIEKNKDTVSDEQLAVLNSSELPLLKDVITIEEDPAAAQLQEAKTSSARGGGATAKKPTLGAIFKASLVKLMATLRTTEVHYIRCIKPNQTKTPFGFEPQMVLSQLRACGVLETIRISCAGYPSRWTFQEFADRYYLLVPSKSWVADAKALTRTVVKAAISNEDKYQMGLTKIFFRAGQLAYLEKLRSEKLRQCVVLIQKNIRRHIYGKKFRDMRKSAILIQKSKFSVTLLVGSIVMTDWAIFSLERISCPSIVPSRTRTSCGHQDSKGRSPLPCHQEVPKDSRCRHQNSSHIPYAPGQGQLAYFASREGCDYYPKSLPWLPRSQMVQPYHQTHRLATILRA